jgi:RimJ/RimL family protein N-acetyltransferase
MNIELRKFERADIPYLIKWVNKRPGEQYLFPAVPVDEAAAAAWYAKSTAERSRRDYMAELYGTPIGLAGLEGIDEAAGGARVYVFMGEVGYNNVRATATVCLMLLRTAFRKLGLRRAYLFIPPDDGEGRSIFESIGFSDSGVLSGRRRMDISAETYERLDGTM